MNNIKIASSALLLSATITFFMLASCHKPRTEISMSDFPNKTGDQWIYYVQDSLYNFNDTLTVTVLSPDTFKGLPSLLWQYSYSNGTIDTLQAVISGDTINFYTNQTFPTLSLALLFPFTASSNWNDNSSASYSVSYIGNYTYLGQSFMGVYSISHTASAPFGYALTDNIDIDPTIGIVHRRIVEFDAGPVINQAWTLINYHLN